MDIADSDDDEEKKGWRVERMDTTSGLQKSLRERVRLYKTSSVVFFHIIHFNLENWISLFIMLLINKNLMQVIVFRKQYVRSE